MMCGLTGLFRPDGAPVDAALLARMNTALAARGPDGDGYHVEPGVGFGHRRLSIIDIEGGHQPMFNEDRSVVIVFNGMIYNFRELWPKLQALGHVFHSDHSDTEAIVHAWESWGPDCLQHLNGMFAFALWDRNRGQFFMARDRLGKKPMHYAMLPDGGLAFASELKAFSPVPGIDRSLSPQAIDDFFTFGYVPDPATIYHGIHKLEAAHFLLVERDGSSKGPQRYWDVPIAPQAISEADAMVALRAHLDDAVDLRLASDVPLGAFLSGGVDSSAVVATAARMRSEPLTTFTIGFEGGEDETPFAEVMAARYHTDQHNERAAAVDMIDAARLQAVIFGEPFGDTSSVPTKSVCALARRHVTVALSGDGGDEVFAGYRRTRWHSMTEGVRRHIPGPLRRQVLGRLASIYPKLDRAPRFLRAKHTLTELGLDSAMGYARMVTKTHQAQRRAIFSAPLNAALDGHDPHARIAALMERCPSEDALVQAQYVDLHSYLVGDILTKVDRTSMANSLEVRAPFLDHRFVAWGLNLPVELKLRGNSGKYILKRALEDAVPHEILYRPKQGFATSLAGLFRAHAGRLRARLLGTAMIESGLFNPTGIARLIDAHAIGSFDHSSVLWLLLVFEGFLMEQAMAQAYEAIPEAIAAE
jgi:asparagine synthase (glutamine-hydrolysing)